MQLFGMIAQTGQSDEPEVVQTAKNLSVNLKSVDIVELWFPISGTPNSIKKPKQV